MKLRFLLVCILTLGCSEAGEVAGPPEEGKEAEHPDVLRIKESNISYVNSSAVRSGFESHLGLVSEVYGRHALAEGRSYVLRGHKLAFGELSSASWSRAEVALEGQYFGTTAERDPKCAVVIGVPGIFASSDGVAVMKEELQRLFDQGDNFACRPAVFVFYNSSSKSLAGVTESCLARAFQLDLPDDASKCPGALGDLVQARRQMAEIMGNAPVGIEADATKLSELVKKLREEGWPVILASHSQGVLMAIQALKNLRPEQCVKSIALGSPVGRSAFTRYGWTSEGFMIEGDILGILGDNDYERISTDISRAADKEMLRLSLLAGPIFAWRGVELSVDIHAFTSSYMAGQESRSRISEIERKQVNDLYGRDCTHRPESEFIYASSGNPVLSTAPSSLWKVEPTAEGADIAIGVIRTSSGERPTITDIAVHPDGSYWAVSPDKLYQLNVSNGSITEFGLLAEGDVNAATFDKDGYLYTATRDGMLVKRSLHPFETKWVGFIGEEVSGDLVFSPDGKLYVVLDMGFSGPKLATINLQDAEPNICSGTIGFSRVWGLVWRDSLLLGLTAEAGTGSLIRIDPATCRGSRIRYLGFQAFGAAKH